MKCRTTPTFHEDEPFLPGNTSFLVVDKELYDFAEVCGVVFLRIFDYIAFIEKGREDEVLWLVFNPPPRHAFLTVSSCNYRRLCECGEGPRIGTTYASGHVSPRGKVHEGELPSHHKDQKDSESRPAKAVLESCQQAGHLALPPCQPPCPVAHRRPALQLEYVSL